METTAAGPGEEVVKYSRKEVFKLMKGHLKLKLCDQIETLKQKIFKDSGCTIDINESMKISITALFYRIRIKWSQCCRCERRFLQVNDKWLNQVISFPVSASGRKTLTEEVDQLPTEVDQPHTEFDQLPTEFDSSSHSVEFERCDIMTEDRKSVDSTVENTLSDEAVLSFLLEFNFSKSQYEGLRLMSMDHNGKVYPPYKSLRNAKKRCCLPDTAFRITDCSAEVQLQSLLDHTVNRILLLKNDVIRSLYQEKLNKMVLVCKWGCNRDSGQNEHEDIFTDKGVSVANVLFISVVPVQLLYMDDELNAEIIVWKNPRPLSSLRFCRPVKLKFFYEDSESVVDEVRYIEKQIQSLDPMKIVVDGKDFSIVYKIEKLPEAEVARIRDIKEYCKDFMPTNLTPKLMKYMFNKLLVISDPYISSIRKAPQKNLKGPAIDVDSEIDCHSDVNIHSDIDSD